MRRLAWMVFLGVCLLSSPLLAQSAVDLTAIRQKTDITEGDREQIRAYVQQNLQKMLVAAEPQTMLSARDAILDEAVKPEGRTAEYRQAFAEVTLAVFEEANKKVAQQAAGEARINFMMIVARLQSVDGVSLLCGALENDQFPGSRYWAAKGLALVAPVIVERVRPRLEAQIAETAGKVWPTSPPSEVLLQLFDALGRFDHEQAHDALAQGVTLAARRGTFDDPLLKDALLGAIKALERAYGQEVRAEAKQRVLQAYATLCARVMPSSGTQRLMTDLNATLEKLLNDSTGFGAAESLPMQKLALLEWVEKLLRSKKIAKRPELPEEVEEAVNAATSSGGAPGTGGETGT